MKQLPAVESIHTTFPMKWWNSGIAWMIASKKVYPVLFDFMYSHKLWEKLSKENVQSVTMEIYHANPEVSNVSYFIPLEQVKEFRLTPHS